MHLDRLLTTRERQIVLVVLEGLSNKEIGRRLTLTEGTVKVHLHKMTTLAPTPMGRAFLV